MEQQYKQILDYMLSCGKRIKTRSGVLEDIGVTKQYLTEEDLAIEHGFKEIIKTFGDGHSLYAEEAHAELKKTAHVWIVDPISGTKTFIKGAPHFAIVVTHLYNNEAQFAAVYDPSVDEMFTAYKGKGAYLNREKITIPQPARGIDIELRIDTQWKQTPKAKHMLHALYENYQIKTSMHSVGIDYCYVACGRYDGIVAFMKDAFPEFAGSFIIREAGGVFTTAEGNEHFTPEDRFFIASNKEMHQKLLTLYKEG